MNRLPVAVCSMIALALVPAAYQFTLRHRDPADFPKLVTQLERVSLCPESWEMRETIYEFGDEWRNRLGLHHHRTVELTTPEGIRLTVLLMLSETGEQLYHTPAVCYAARGCGIRGDVVPLTLHGEVSGEVRAVEVIFDEIVGELSRTAAYAYWVSPNWKSPPQSSILNHMGREPFLLKVQLLLEDARPADSRTQNVINDYLEFLASQLLQSDIV